MKKAINSQPLSWFFIACTNVFTLLLSPISVAVTLPENFSELSEDVQAVILEYTLFSEQAHAVWEDDTQTSAHNLVKYLDDFHTRVQVNFAKGWVRVESNGSKTPITSIRKAIVATLLTPADPDAIDLYTVADFGLTGKPFLAGQVLDRDGKSILTPWRAERYARYLTEHKLRRKGAYFWVNIPLVSDYKRINANQYRALVSRSSRRYQVPEALIFAVIETESSFNPLAVSHAGAYGLMQVMQKTAGRDVFQRIYKKQGQPGRRTLLKAATNIDIGTAYLSILRDVYLRKIKGQLKRQYCVIAAYNGGAGNLLKTFHRSRKKALQRINNMTAEQVYRTIVRHHPKKESRDYLQKVVRFKQKYVR